MAKDTNIEWTNHTINLWWGCTKVHRGCDNCYAERLANRWNNKVWGNLNPRKIIKSAFSNLGKYQQTAKSNNRIDKVFVGSMMDIFEKDMPLVDHKGESLEISTNELREKLFQNISNNLYPNLIFQFLTKRPSNINKMIPFSWKCDPPKNVMFGASVVDTKSMKDVTRHLKKVKGYKFLSIEPLLEEIELIADGIDWVIVGGESGPKKRAFDVNWAKKIHLVCISNKIPFFFKQIDKVQQIPEEMLIREFPKFFNN